MRANNDPCLTCERPECTGICDKIRDTMGEIDTSKAIHTITWHGVTRSVNEWAEILGIGRSTLYRQIDDTSIDEYMQSLVSRKTSKTDLPKGSIEETYIRLSTLHLDYLLFWNRMSSVDSSSGLIARYGVIQLAPTNAVSNPTESKALPETSMSDEALYRRGWVACVLYMIEQYHVRNKQTGMPNDRLRAKLLQWRAIDGYTMRKIAEKLTNEQHPSDRPITPMRVRKYMNPVIEDVTREALRRKLIRGTQK